MSKLFRDPSAAAEQPMTSHQRRLPTAELVLIRGLPGSGKTTMARVLAQVGYEHFEADQFFMVDGVYRYDASRIRDAHAWCQRKTLEALALGRRVVVSNTFTRLQEMEQYRAMTSNVRVIEAKGRWQNVHGVPNERLRQMAERWEPLPPLDPQIERRAPMRRSF